MSTVVWVDTNVARDGKRLLKIVRLAMKKRVPVRVDAIVYLERARQLRVATGADFDDKLFDEFLDSNWIEVGAIAVDRPSAARWAERLWQWYPDETKWREAKLRAVKSRAVEGLSFKAKEVPTTTDWLIILNATDSEEHVLVSEDKGAEWSHLRSAIPPRARTYAETLEWLDELPDPAP